jgi:hypothetical protein
VYLRTTVSVDGSPPIGVLVDTGSNGLRIFASALGGTSISSSNEALSVDFGGDLLAGHKASAVVHIGSMATASPISIQLVETFSCSPSFPDCNVSDNTGTAYTSAGINGILGIGLRPATDGLYSPLAQLGSPIADGFTIHFDGLDSTTGELRLGPPATEGSAQVQLERSGEFPNGLSAWSDDTVSVCYSVNGAAPQPACVDTVFDTGSNMDVVYGKGLGAATVTADGYLAPGLAFEAKHEGVFDLKYTTGTKTSRDLVMVATDDPFTILGVGTFFRYELRFDRVNGKLGFHGL